MERLLSEYCYNWRVKAASRMGSEGMEKLIEIRNQEFLCRERALLDPERRPFWLEKAKEWEQRALDEIVYHFRECNLVKSRSDD
jgi:hypothetical protein